ncbi:hypothetical protein [Streptomyces hydrogenans]|uniref:hypothetical protein n=1 Tax=Streptomyces hydrogenans TaxID=1873719 RepID=UPI0034288346
MPLSVPLLLVPGEPDRRYTVHLHRAQWYANALHPGQQILPPQMRADAAREGLRMVSECIAAELGDADVEVTENPDGSAEAVARVLCTEDVCAAVAARYQRDADEDVEAEAARAWAANRLRDQTVELLVLRAEAERSTPGKTAASVQDMLTAVLAAQQERTGGAADRVVVMVDELAYLMHQSGLAPDGTPEAAREQISRLMQQGRAPFPVSNPDRAPNGTVWQTPAFSRRFDAPRTAEGLAHPHMPDLFNIPPADLMREAEHLARTVAAGMGGRSNTERLAALCGELARRHGANPYPRPCPGGCREDDTHHALVHRIGHRPAAVTAGEVRAVGLTPGPAMILRTLPELLPADDAAVVLVYRRDTPGIGILDALLTGSETAFRGAVDGTLMWLTQDEE